MALGARAYHRISIHPPCEGWDDRRAVKLLIRPHISIHPPREGWDAMREPALRLPKDFNPPTPRGVGHVCLTVCQVDI